MSVLVFSENWDGKFKKSSFELVSYASKIAEMLNTSVTALSIGSLEESELKKLGNYGASSASTRRERSSRSSASGAAPMSVHR